MKKLSKFVKATALASALALASCDLGLNNDEPSEEEKKQTNEINEMKSNPNYVYSKTNLSCNDVQRISSLPANEAIHEICTNDIEIHTKHIPLPPLVGMDNYDECVEKINDNYGEFTDYLREVVARQTARLRCYNRFDDSIKQLNGEGKEVKTKDDCVFEHYDTNRDPRPKTVQIDICNEL